MQSSGRPRWVPGKGRGQRAHLRARRLHPHQLLVLLLLRRVRPPALTAIAALQAWKEGKGREGERKESRWAFTAWPPQRQPPPAPHSLPRCFLPARCTASTSSVSKTGRWAHTVQAYL